MKLNKFLASALFAAGLAVGAGQASAAVVFDFANANVPAGSYKYSSQEDSYSNGSAVSMLGVDFGGMSGVQTNGSAWNFPAAPDGASAFIQSYSGAPGAPGIITFNLSSITSGAQQVTFSDSGRPSYAPETFTVMYGSESLGTYTAGAAGWTTQTTLTFIANGSNLVFTGTSPTVGDNDVGIAHVTVTAVPELSTWLMMLAGFAGLGFVGARRNRNVATFA